MCKGLRVSSNRVHQSVLRVNEKVANDKADQDLLRKDAYARCPFGQSDLMVAERIARPVPCAVQDDLRPACFEHIPE